MPIGVTRATARSAELLAAGAAVVIATDRENVADAAHRRTGGTGVDVVLDLVRGPGQQDLLAATRPGGTLVAAGFLDPRPTPDPGDAPVTVVDYRAFDHLVDPSVVRRAAAFLDAGVRLGALQPAIDQVFALDDVVAAHRRFDHGLHGGKKIVVTL
ncbi:zinc-binding dehydrogenase [Actinocatenispora sera]|uniref:Zinc-binding dehydrogenase n=1 Tax=Actinocatenispora sera TaxID=390989 RepID=A0A810L289_9ACTN|nr:zinc-binding dehydrogenase [Actinocatenispora sera]BCJ28762.1 hypothetical protein Asera_28700 [Actinocatenispora sera]